MAALTASLITVNWGIYVWAIAADRAVETALGYYINPLVIVVHGRRPARREARAACRSRRSGWRRVAVLVLTFEGGGMPWVSLALAISLAFYALPAQDAADRPEPGLFPRGADPQRPGAGLHRLAAGAAARAISCHPEPADIALLLGCGPVTAVPLMLYAIRRQAAALLDHRHHAIHRADDDFPHRHLRLP